MKNFLEIRCFIILLLVLLGLSGCSQKSVEQSVAEPVNTQEQTAITAELEEHGVIDAHEYDDGIEAITAGNYSTARDIFTRFAEKNPGLSGAYINLALIAYRQESYEEAEKLAERVLEINPEHAQTFHLRALLHLQNGDIRLAERDYKTAIELNPGYAIAHYNLALLYDIFLQQLEPAIEHYSIYLQLIDHEDEETRNWINHLENSLANG